MEIEINLLLDKFGQKRGKIDLSLERIIEFLKLIGSPHLRLPPVIHVAGTNGKGSTIAFLKAMIQADGKTCHVYTSPHLVKFNERIVICGEQISDENLLKLLREVDAEYEQQKSQIELTFFELTTITAFVAFSRVDADYVLLETGMGGRFDATNIISNPLLTIITPISLDHTEYLGEKISQIAVEKAGIMKRDVMCISAPQTAEVAEVLKQKASELNCQIDFVKQQNNYGELALKGQHQEINATVASEAARVIGLSQQAVFNGLKSAKWPGRLQKLVNGELVGLLAGGFELWLDGAHNVAGAESLAAELGKTSQDNFLILGMLNNRDAKIFLRKFKNIKMLGTILIPNQLNSHSAADLAKCGADLNIPSQAFATVSDAIKYIVANNSKGSMYICGSLYLVGEILKFNN